MGFLVVVMGLGFLIMAIFDSAIFTVKLLMEHFFPRVPSKPEAGFGARINRNHHRSI